MAHGWFGTFTGVVLVPVAGLPVAALLAWALARHRGPTEPTAAWRRSLAGVGIVYGVLAAALSLLDETAQCVLRLARVSSVDDVLLNAAGAGLAAPASRRWWRTGEVALRKESG